MSLLKSSLLPIFLIMYFYSSLAVRFEYPKVKRQENIVDNYFGNNVSDPYRWLEDLNSEDSKNFVEEQNNLSKRYIETFPQREEIVHSLTSLLNYTNTNAPRKAGNRYFFSSEQGGQNHSVYYYKNSYDGPPLVALDPNTFPEEGTPSISGGTVIPSNDGQILSYGISYGGVDWYNVHFKNISSGDVFPEKLTDIKLSDFIWTPDSKGVIYARYVAANPSNGSDKALKKRQNLYYHKIGTNQSEDVLLVEFPKNLTYVVGHDNVHITSDGKYLIMTPYNSHPNNFLLYADIEDSVKNQFQDGNLKVKTLDGKGESVYKFLANVGSIIYFLTSKDASNRQILSIDLKSISESSQPEVSDWKTVIPEESYRLDWARVTNKNVLVLSYLKDVKSSLELRSLENGTLIKKIPLENGILSDVFLPHGNFEDNEFYYQFSSYLTPGKVFRINFENKLLEPELVSENIIPGYNSSDFVTTQVFYSSYDGTKVPMYILHKKDYIPQGNTPCFLYSYGGFGINIFYKFLEDYIYFMRAFNGIVALPSIRGGGEYGEKWHEAGKHHNKQNGFNDFAAAAEYLIREKYTEPSKIIINGASQGGLLMAVSINQRPDLYGAAIVQVGVTDMIRFQLHTDVTHAIDEYGIANNEEDFNTLIKYSPLHNVRFPENETVQYPATLVTTGNKDDRVPPHQSYKLIAELQYKIGQSTRQTNPLLLRVYSNTGHGDGRSSSLIIQELADMFSFISQTLKLNITNF